MTTVENHCAAAMALITEWRVAAYQLVHYSASDDGCGYVFTFAAWGLLMARRTDEEMAEDQALATQMMDLRVPSTAIVALLMQRGVSRSSAYRTLAYAGEARSDRIEASPTGSAMAKACQSILMQTLVTAYADGDTKLVPRLAKELREALKMTGDYAGDPPQDDDVDQVIQTHQALQD